jgi:hypothetical protein
MSEEIEIEEVEIEVYALRGEAVPRARRYKIRIDKTHYIVETPHPTGLQLLAKAGKTPEHWLLYQIFRGRQPEPVEPSAHVDLTKPGVERFTTVQKDPTEGLVTSPRREFSLSSGDKEFLDQLGKRWELIMDGQTLTVLVHDWEIPDGYNVSYALLALRLPTGYPDTQIDMVYFLPHLVRQDGKPVANLSDASVCELPFQQWSRHRTSERPWRLGEDDLSTHLSLVDDWLRREFRKG